METGEKVCSLVKVPICDDCGHRFEDLEYREWTDNKIDISTIRYRFRPDICPGCGNPITGVELDLSKKIVRVHVLGGI